MTMELVLNVVAVIVAGACLWWAVRGLGAFLAWVERSEIARQAAETAAAKPIVVPSATAGPAPVVRGGIPAEHVAAIAAAVAVVMEGHRVVLIEDDASGLLWASEGRWQHQTSHRVH